MKDEGTRFGPRLVKSGVSIGFELATGLRCNHVADLYTVTAYLRTTEGNRVSLPLTLLSVSKATARIDGVLLGRNILRFNGINTVYELASNREEGVTYIPYLMAPNSGERIPYLTEEEVSMFQQQQYTIVPN